jgi:uncharacterized membrane protein YkoI
MKKLCAAWLLCIVGMGVAVPTAADDDQGNARRALAAGEIMPLEKILDTVEASFNGQVVEVELEREHARWQYEIELLTREGNVIELTYDAANARLLESEGRGIDAARKKP